MRFKSGHSKPQCVAPGAKVVFYIFNGLLKNLTNR